MLFLSADYNFIAKQSAARLNLASLSLELGKALQRLPLRQC
jgi:hypothetical protein